MLSNVLLCLCELVCAGLAIDPRESKVVQIAQGPVRGYKDPGTGVYFFQGIPYASTPSGTSRFKAPLPPPTWTAPLEAVTQNIACPQATMPQLQAGDDLIPHIKKQEDCLIANVYVPDTQEENLSVLVVVHGGAFQIGYGDLLIPTKLVKENNIIAVTINYRLGAHGFLCLGTKDIPGNAGMKDQVAALRWIKKNIASFGGDPDDITIEGYSSGSAAVDLLMLSKSAEGLFSKVIPESGGSTALWVIQSDPLENAKQHAKYLNFTDVDDIFALEQFYKTISFEELNNVPHYNSPDSVFGLAPCLERHMGEEVFLDKSPVDILKSGDYKKLPLLYGFTTMEGLLRIRLFDTFKEKMNENFSNFLPADLKFESKEQKREVAKRVKEFYFGDKPVSEETILGYVDYFSDVIVVYAMLRAVKYHVEAGHDQIYLYHYSFVDDNTPVVPHTGIKGAYHCAQTEAVFEKLPERVPKVLTDEFKNMSSIINKIWGNFIKTGYPIPEGSSLPPWPAVGDGCSPHMSLGNKSSLGGPLLEHRTRFWDDIYSKYYRDPIPPLKYTQIQNIDL